MQNQLGEGGKLTARRQSGSHTESQTEMEVVVVVEVKRVKCRNYFGISSIFQVEPSNPDLVNVNTVQLKVVFPMKDVVQ